MITQFVKGHMMLFPFQLSQYHSNRILLTTLTLFRTFQKHIYFINRGKPLLTKTSLSNVHYVPNKVVGVMGNKGSLTCGPCPERLLSNWRGK